jgi:hypothetical protein
MYIYKYLVHWLTLGIYSHLQATGKAITIKYRQGDRFKVASEAMTMAVMILL